MPSEQTRLPELGVNPEEGTSVGGARPTGEESGERRPRFRVIDRSQSKMRVLVIDRLIGEDHPARAIWDFVGRLDLSGYGRGIRAVEGMAGRSALSPQLLICLWCYAYSVGVS